MTWQFIEIILLTAVSCFIYKNVKTETGEFLFLMIIFDLLKIWRYQRSDSFHFK